MARFARLERGELRVAVQLVDAVTGANLWAEAYEREFSPDAIFELQDDLVPRIVSTVADTYGVLPHSMSESLRSKAENQLTPIRTRRSDPAALVTTNGSRRTSMRR